MATLIRSAALAAATLLAVTAAAGCSSGAKDEGAPSKSPTSQEKNGDAEPGALPAALTGQQLDWAGCEAPSVAQGGGDAPGKGWECATMKAPLDHAKPTGETIEIALIRKQATDKDKRIGSLVYNFGGPGGSGVATLPWAAEEYGDLGERYDLVSFDPRGVGDTIPVKCLTDKEIDEERATDEDAPRNASEEKEFLQDDKEYSETCEQKSGKYLPYVGTKDTARDMDLMRQVLGDKKLNYFGISYGTELGGVYAHLFPKNVGRTVFDAVVDPTADTVRSSIDQIKGFQLALDNYLKSTGQDPKTGSEKLARLLDRIEESPLPTDTGRKLTRGGATTGIASLLYAEKYWDWLTQALDEAEAGTGNQLLSYADQYLDRDEKGRYSNSTTAMGAIRCADTSERLTIADAKKHMAEFEAASPVFGRDSAWGLVNCAHWPVKGSTVHPVVSAPGADPIVVIGNAGDPATPVAGAKKMAAELGKDVGVNITVQGEGHGTYGVNSCATKAVDGYLLDGKVPSDGLTCK
ncbi:alpha/beta hydrolase [Streptomyces sp. NBC_01304]|uniref:alpha/beta hydrolase n=1 Tax=Streptomyces sp. NBC_01304 TaxID=2903818 RepID=UPI002E0FE442|nr:alpha/beta fold hydrolase [Streptomyces sp. NBC_01304]